MKVTKFSLIRDFFRDHKILLSFTFLSGILNSMVNLAVPVFIGKYYQLAFHTHSPRGKMLDGIIKLKQLDTFFLFFIGLIVIKVLFTFLEKFLTGYSGEVFSKRMREDLFTTQLQFTLPAFEKKAPGKYLLRYSGDLSAIQRYVMKGIIRFTIDVIFLFLAFSLLALIHIPMTLMVFGAFVVFFFVVFYLNKYLRRLTIKRRNIRSEMLSFVTSRLHGLLTVKVFNREAIESQKYEVSSRKLFRFGRQYFQWYGLISGLFPLFLYAMLGFVLYYAHMLRVINKDEIAAHEILIFIMVLINLLPILRRIFEVTTVWQAGNVSIMKILRIFNSETEVKDKEEELKFETGNIEIRNLSFSYPNGRNVWNDFSCSVPANSITLLKGKQGMGKSTLLKIMLGLYPVTEGEITVDGQSLLSLNKHTIRKNITLVSDELPLLGKTIFEVISYSRKEEKKVKALQILEKLKFSPDGNFPIDLDFPLEMGARNLSAGQRKVLQIARALLTRKKIILLDDPFSGLDDATIRTVSELLNDLKRKRTILVVSNSDLPSLAVDQLITL